MPEKYRCGKMEYMLRKMILVVFLLFLITGCTPVAVAPTPELPTAFPTTIPSPTPLPPATRVILTGSNLPASETENLVTLTQSLAATSGLTVERVDIITPEMMTPDVRMVISLPGSTSASDLAAHYPAISFISISNSGIQPSANLFAISSEGTHPEWIGFMAGYIAAITTYEWRIGVLALAGNNDEALAADAFRNGAIFFCGLCNPYHPPWTDYPAAVAMNPPTNQADWQPWADQIITSDIKTVFVTPGVYNTELLTYLAGSGIRLMGSQTPADALRPAWIATINLDYSEALTTAWGEATASMPGRSLSATLQVTDVDAALIGEGKMRLIHETIAALTAGHIAPSTIP